MFLARQQHNSAHANHQLSSSKYGNSSQNWILEVNVCENILSKPWDKGWGTLKGSVLLRIRTTTCFADAVKVGIVSYVLVCYCIKL
jgi:hypothetical protein